jgi:hypothetical protein
MTNYNAPLNDRILLELVQQHSVVRVLFSFSASCLKLLLCLVTQGTAGDMMHGFK